MLLGLLPSLAWLSLFLKEDVHPEPRSLLAKTFLMGIIISPLAVLLQVGFGYLGKIGPADYFVSDGSLFFLWAAFVEELSKFFAVWFVALRDPEFDEPVDAIIYMITAGLGFAAIENILVLFRTIASGVNTAMSVWLLRSVGATLLHALSAGILGYFLALAWFFRGHQKKLIVLGLCVSTLFHFSFNLFLAAQGNQVRGLGLATALLCLMAFLVYILFAKIKSRNSQPKLKLVPAVEKEITSV